MNKKQEKKVAVILLKLYDIVLAEECGSAEHICEYFDSEELEELIKELKIKIPSNLSNNEIEEAVDDCIDDLGWSGMDDYDEDEVKEWLDDTDLNKTAREKFFATLKSKLS
jgi:signal recognition particle receptor subunit beta